MPSVSGTRTSGRVRRLVRENGDGPGREQWLLGRTVDHLREDLTHDRRQLDSVPVRQEKHESDRVHRSGLTRRR